MSLPSYPYDGGPRFVAVSGGGMADVLDRGDCHRIVAHYDRAQGPLQPARLLAERRAAELNAWNDEVDSAA